MYVKKNPAHPWIRKVTRKGGGRGETCARSLYNRSFSVNNRASGLMSSVILRSLLVHQMQIQHYLEEVSESRTL